MIYKTKAVEFAVPLCIPEADMNRDSNEGENGRDCSTLYSLLEKECEHGRFPVE